MPDTELAEELLQLEEADAWFEYLESTRGQTEKRYGGRSSRGHGRAFRSAARGPGSPVAPPPRSWTLDTGRQLHCRSGQ